MGLFERKANNYTTASDYYSMGENKTILVVGLGNIGKQYKGNRHNVGFMAVDRYRESHDFSDWIEKKDLRCFVATGNVGSTRVIVAKPTTMMNLSGEAAQAIQHFYKVQNEDTLVVYDELDIDFGTIRTRSSGMSAGHNGIKSLLAHINDGFGRIRVGIGPKSHAKMDSADFVLQDFSVEQTELLPKILREISALIDERTVGPLSDHSVAVL
jgi:peptidyl-tRNA hydrolase, PTH1 family